MSTDPDWWRDAVVYQVYPRSFADSDGDGLGDLPGVTSRLDYLSRLGVDAVWLSPFFVSPQADAGYDVADYRAVDPIFGTLADADSLIAEAGARGLRVLLDLVPNHSSDEHPWFQAALAAPPGAPQRELYHFADGRGPEGARPPNNWRSVFGGPAWTRVTEADGAPGQWYLHLFDTRQPDWNWEHPAVQAEFEAVLRFWLDRGVAGFRIDVAHGLVKAPGLPDTTVAQTLLGLDVVADGMTPEATPTHAMPYWDQDGVHAVYRRWRRLLDSYGPPARILCAEAWVTPAERMARYLRSDEIHQGFAFDVLQAPWDARALRAAITTELDTLQAVGATPTWVLSNHDVVRHATRLGLPRPGGLPHGIRATDPQPNRWLGHTRARAATSLLLALPGAAYLYQGEELGLPDHTTLPDGFRQDPVHLRTGGAEVGRDGCRVPLPWRAEAPAYGFSPSGRSWLPQPREFREYAADRQVGVPGSTHELYRQLLALRRAHRLGRGELVWESKAKTKDLLVLRNGPVRVIVNFGAVPIAVNPDWQVLVASGPLEPVDGSLPPDTAVWVRAE